MAQIRLPSTQIRRLFRAALLFVFLSASASAQQPPIHSAQTLFDQAQQAEAELRLADALESYQQAINTDPSAPFALIAKSRITYLTTHAEGNFAPLMRVQQLRKNPSLLDNHDALLALETEIDAFPTGRVRSEARTILAEAFWHRHGDTSRAARAFNQILGDSSADRLTQALAVKQLVTLYQQQGDLTAAHQLVQRYPDLAPSTTALVHRLVRRSYLKLISLAALLLLAVTSTLFLIRARKRKTLLFKRILRPVSVVLALLISGGAAMIAYLKGGDSDPKPFLWLGIGVFGIDIMARSLHLALPHTKLYLRIGWAIVCVACVIAIAFITLEQTYPSYLNRIGL